MTAREQADQLQVLIKEKGILLEKARKQGNDARDRFTKGKEARESLNKRLVALDQVVSSSRQEYEHSTDAVSKLMGELSHLESKLSALGPV